MSHYCVAFWPLNLKYLASAYREHLISSSHSIVVLVIARHIHPVQVKHDPTFYAYTQRFFFGIFESQKNRLKSQILSSFFRIEIEPKKNVKKKEKKKKN